MLTSIVLFFLTFVITACNSTGTDDPVVEIGSSEFSVEMADTQQLRSLGLSGRESLAAGTGMLFMFDNQASQFWMKDMLIPIDIIWISTDCLVVDINTSIQPPEKGTPDFSLPRYQSTIPARYVLELNAGEVGAHKIKPGDKVHFIGLPDKSITSCN